MKKKNSTMINLTDRLKKEIKPISKSEISNISEEYLKDIINFSLIQEISPSVEIGNFLKEQTIKMFSIQAKSAILIGEILTNVHEKLSGQGSENGVYEKWLEINNFSRATAWRYRQRYSIYSKVNDDKKQIIATIPQNLISEIYKNEDLEGIINIINECSDKKEVVNSLNDILELETRKIESKKIEDEKKAEIFETFEVKNYISILATIEEKVNKLSSEEKKELEKHLKSIEKLLK